MTISELGAGIDQRYFRNVLGNFPTGVVAVTSVDTDGAPVGMAVGSFTAVSLDPPLVAFLPDKSSSTFPKVRQSGRFCVNILSARQQDVCRKLSLKGVDKFAGLDWVHTPQGLPRVEGSIAWIDCCIEDIHEAGDHYIVVGRVASLEVDEADSPLIFFQGGYGRFASTSLTAPAEADLFRPLSLVDRARPQMAALAEDLGVECCASTAIGDQLVLIGSSMSRNLRTSPHKRLGQRMPWVPPLALPLIAWADKRTKDAWVARGGDAVDRSQLAAAIERVRDRGWSMVLRSTAQLQFEKAVARLPLTDATKDLADELTHAAAGLGLEGYEPETIEPGATYDARIISAPIFDETGQPALLLSLYQIPRGLSGSELLGCRDRLLAAASEVTTLIGGRRPEEG
jgi:flavin reductase (DIM6/NTAB) family NADH-FMN oxidoreductase RutF/DNA-binding IclR family transcriptional regulator